MTPETTRAFGACFVKGCKYRHVTDNLIAGTGHDKGRVMFENERGHVVHAVAGYFSQVDAQMKVAGLVCPEHGATMRYEGLNATYNPEKVCDGRCMNAKRASCDCSCKGENHGKNGLQEAREDPGSPGVLFVLPGKCLLRLLAFVSNLVPVSKQPAEGARNAERDHRPGRPHRDLHHPH